MDAYIESWRISDLATANPGADWSAQVAEYMADPFRSDFMDGLAGLAKRGNHTVGHASVSAVLVSVTASSATINSCVDTTHQDTLNKDGRSVVVANGPGAYWRYVEIAYMTKIGSKWKLSQIDDQRKKTC